MPTVSSFIKGRWRHLPRHNTHVRRTCAGAARCDSVSVPPAGCTSMLAPRRLHVPELTSQQAREGEVGTTPSLLTTSSGGDQSGIALGENPEPPGPQKTRPGPGFPPDPFPASPANYDRPRRANDRGKPPRPPRIPGRTFRLAETASTGEPANPPAARFPGPPPAFPRPEGTLRGHNRLTYHADPAPAETITPPRRHPGHRHYLPGEEPAPDSRKGHSHGARVPLRDRQRIS
jgi:hypothetical protein